MEIWRTIKVSFVVLFVLSIPLTGISMYGMATNSIYPHETTYEYEVKAQQVFDGEHVEDSDITEFEDLSDDEQEVLYEAFKKSDHFMGTSEVYVSNGPERLDTFHDWRTVESNGVLLLVAINEHTETTPDSSEYEWYHWISIFGMIYFTFILFILIVIPRTMFRRKS